MSQCLFLAFRPRNQGMKLCIELETDYHSDREVFAFVDGHMIFLLIASVP